LDLSLTDLNKSGSGSTIGSTLRGGGVVSTTDDIIVTDEHVFVCVIIVEGGQRIDCTPQRVVMGNPFWDCGPVLAVAVHIVAETVTQPYFRFCCLQFHHSFNDNVS
jgi:hypothetical protein